AWRGLSAFSSGAPPLRLSTVWVTSLATLPTTLPTGVHSVAAAIVPTTSLTALVTGASEETTSSLLTLPPSSPQGGLLLGGEQSDAAVCAPSLSFPSCVSDTGRLVRLSSSEELIASLGFKNSASEPIMGSNMRDDRVACVVMAFSCRF